MQFRIKDDDEFLNQPLYSQTYSTDVAAAVHSWVLIALPAVVGGMGGALGVGGALEGPTPAPLALMPPVQ